MYFRWEVDSFSKQRKRWRTLPIRWRTRWEVAVSVACHRTMGSYWKGLLFALLTRDVLIWMYVVTFMMRKKHIHMILVLPGYICLCTLVAMFSLHLYLHSIFFVISIFYLLHFIMPCYIILFIKISKLIICGQHVKCCRSFSVKSHCILTCPRYLTSTFVHVIDFASGEVLNFGLKVRSSPTLRMGVWASTWSEDCLNVSLKAAINILFFFFLCDSRCWKIGW